MIPIPTEKVAVAASEPSNMANMSCNAIQAPVILKISETTPTNNKLPIRFNTSDQTM